MPNDRNLLALRCALVLLLWSQLLRPALAEATPTDKLQVLPGFSAELLYSVPNEQGSWVSITSDPQGRLIVSDQGGKLYRVTPPPGGDATDETKVEPIDLNIGAAQGLLCAFDSLYVVSYGIKSDDLATGFYRVRDTNGDDQYDEVKLLREFEGGGEHGPHAVILSPDGQSLYLCAGNHTTLPELAASRLPQHWQEDQVLPRLPDPAGHANGRMAPGGWICKVDPEGKSFELLSAGYRNEYDIALDPNGELFTYDADMEWDIGLPWYRPTRICHAVSGSEFGWRYGSGKWPEYYPDSVPPVENIGPGSPTGVTFGTGAAFPAKYQHALFVADWSYGMIYAVHLKPDGASFEATKEKFCSAAALPVTDMVINPIDGAMYFLIGGRGAQSGLYRISYVGGESTAPGDYPPPEPVAELRRELEAFHRPGASPDLDDLWEYLSHDDLFVRYAARIALEHQSVDIWASRATDETDPQRTLESITALAHSGKENHQAGAVAALARLDWKKLTTQQRIHLLRNYGLVLCRLGRTTEETKGRIRQLEAYFPTDNQAIDRELATLLVAAESPAATEKTVELLLNPSAAERQIAYAKILSDASVGWTQSLRERYFQWFLEMGGSRGGHTFSDYLLSIRNHAVERLNPEDRKSLTEILNKKVEQTDPYAQLKARPFVNKWKLADLVPEDDVVFENRDLANGKKMFATAACFKCHRIQGEGGSVGPDLTPAGHRFNTHDLLDSILNPSKVISDQYAASIFYMDDGRTVVGRVANLSGHDRMIQSDMTDPGNFTTININQVEATQPSDVSMMPEGLLDNLTQEEILDLVAYLKSTYREKDQ
ncbi:c-type cytochrome [Adhaeretor mobilis]|uniref:Cytochrome c n=1 Tax=Adhaeretor mobilis TaxID=1930276 RepID=A0A517MQE1_9BACT|nr:c-type cytochrome [Adhaeretor mobilis]QDS97099.1 Cytochrome c [Adhaeretor mobilis]